MQKQITLFKTGFTLLELVIAIAIGAMLMGITLTSVNVYLENARDSKRIADLARLTDSLERYRSNNASGLYPIPTNYNIRQTSINNLDSSFNNYMKDFPVDPKPINTSCDNYLYSTQDLGKTYTLFTQLENDGNAEAKIAKPTPKSKPAGTSPDNIDYIVSGACNGSYNYWINNP